MKLAPKDTRTILIVGAGTVARSLREAYGAGLSRRRVPHLEPVEGPRDAAGLVVSGHAGVDDLASRGERGRHRHLRHDDDNAGPPGRMAAARSASGPDRRLPPDMREADDAVLRRGRLFVDARHTTIGHIGEVMIPMEAGVIGEEDILADYYDLASGAFARRSVTRSRSSRMAVVRIWT
jgi:ornithine cyclodeaminase